MLSTCAVVFAALRCRLLRPSLIIGDALVSVVVGGPAADDTAFAGGAAATSDAAATSGASPT